MAVINRRSALLFIFITLGVFLSAVYFVLPGHTIKSKIKRLFSDTEKIWLTDVNTDRTGSGYYSKKEELQILSPVFHLDQIYRSMTGPADIFYFQLSGGIQPKLLWITDYSIEVKDKSGKEDLSKDFMCHNNVDLSMSHYLKHWNLERKDILNSRLITLTEGQTELHFPEGFGIPVYSNENISITTQVLNHNIEKPDVDVRHQIKLGFVRHEDLKKAMKPLFKQTINIMAEVDTSKKLNGVYGGRKDCRPAMASIAHLKRDINGKTFTGHWIIKEGIDTLKYPVSNMMKLPFDTKLHFASVHVHPFCEALTLRDVTNNEIIFSSKVKNFTDRIGMEKIDLYSSAEGIQMYKDHRYELICITNNTSKKEQDMMAVMILYFHDMELEKKISSIP